MKSTSLGMKCLAIVLFLNACQKKDLQISDEDAASATTGVASNATANDVAETAFPLHTPIYSTINSNSAGYMETLPARYSLTTKKYPLIVFLHGIGELGSGNPTKLNCCGIPYWVNKKLFPPEFTVNGVKYSFIVISPQFKVKPTPSDIQSVIDFAKKKYRIDETRVYVSGLSLGGGCTFEYASSYGQNAAAVAPICGGTRPTTSMANSIASKYVPVWTVHSQKDEIVPIQYARDWTSWIKAGNSSNAANVKLTEYITENHNSTWGKAYDPQRRVDGYSLYEWMLRFKRSGGTSTPTSPSPTPSPTPAPSPTDGNQLPVATAGADFAVNLSWGNRALLNGTLSKDPDGWLNTATWSKVSGPSGGDISVKSWGQAYANNLVQGTYVFRLTVTDNKGASSTDDVTVYANATGTVPANPTPTPTPTDGNMPPVANAGADQTIPVSWNYSPLINATLSKDPDGWIQSFSWSKVSGPTSYSFADQDGGKTKVNNLVAGTYVFRVTVTDNKGATSTDDVKITMQ